MKILNIGAYRISSRTECPISAKCSIIGISAFVPDNRPGSSHWYVFIKYFRDDRPIRYRHVLQKRFPITFIHVNMLYIFLLGEHCSNMFPEPCRNIRQTFYEQKFVSWVISM